MARNINKEVNKLKEISYTNKDFKSLRQEIQNYALRHFSNEIIDFSDASLGGLLLDMNAYVGDVLMYYLDHQFNENSLEKAIEKTNLERLIREAGLEVPSAAPAYANVDLTIVVPAELVNGVYRPKTISLPTIKKNSVFSTPGGVEFTLLEDVDFSELDKNNNLVASTSIGRLSGANPVNFILRRNATVSSSKIETENIVISNKLIPFRTLTLSKENVNEIISVYDSNGDEYYEVDTLSQDTVFKIYENTKYDFEDVPSRLEIFHAPKRFVTSRSSQTGKTTLRFGSGDENAYDEDVIPDPSEHAIKLFGDRKSFTSIAIDPNSFLTTQTLGISPVDTTLSITYRHGGGLSHNVGAGQINAVKTLITTFVTSTPVSDEVSVRSSLRVFNPETARGGEDEATVEEMRNVALFNRSSQNRIVTREDLLARVYSMPVNFGRVYRASITDNPRNPRGSQLHVISRNAQGKLTTSPDTLKQNMSKYLNKFRIVSDSIDILDAIIVNIGVDYSVTIQKGYRSESVIGAVNSKISEYFNIRNQQINKPIVIGEIENLILNVPGVVNIIKFSINNKVGLENGNSYSGNAFSIKQNLDRGLIFPPPGGIFELKYQNEDIVGRIV